MTLPSTIACGNTVRPTLNFNWNAAPDSSRGNYHSVHNKSHNKHLENDFITIAASIKVSSDPLETQTMQRAQRWWNENCFTHAIEYSFEGGGCEDAHLLGRAWLACVVLRCSLGWRSSETFFPRAIIQICSVFFIYLFFLSKWLAHTYKSKYQKCIGPHNWNPSEQGHVTMGHSQLPVLSLSMPMDVTSTILFLQWDISTSAWLLSTATPCSEVAFIFVVIFKDDILACRPPPLFSAWLFSIRCLAPVAALWWKGRHSIGKQSLKCGWYYSPVCMGEPTQLSWLIKS